MSSNLVENNSVVENRCALGSPSHCSTLSTEGGLSSLALFSLTASGCETLAEEAEKRGTLVEERRKNPTQNSLFKAAGSLFKLQTQSTTALEKQLENESTIMEAEIEALEKMAQFWKTFEPLWAKFQADPSNYQLFKEVMAALEKQYGNDPKAEARLKDLEKRGTSAHQSEQEWQDHGFFYHLFHGMSLSDPNTFNKAMGDINAQLKTLTKEGNGEGLLLGNSIAANQQNFQDRVRQLLSTVRILREIVTILEKSKGGGGQAALFHMESLLMALEELQINSNSHKSDQEQTISQANGQNLEQNLSKIQDCIKKLEESHSGGLWNCIKDFFHSIIPFIKHAAEGLYYGATGQIDRAKEAFNKVGDLAFIKDMGHLVTLLGDLISGGVKLYASYVLLLTGQLEKAKGCLEEAKESGEKILENPAIKTIADIAMVAIIVASCLSGQFALAAIMVTLFVMSQTGTLQKGTEKIAQGLTEIGCDKKWAKVIADVIVIAIITIASAGAGALEASLATSARGAATLAAEEAEAIEMTTFASNGIRQEGTQVASESASSKTASAARQAASLGTFGLGSSLSTSPLILDLLDAMHKKDNQTLVIFLVILQTLAAAVATSVGAATAITQSLPRNLTNAKNATFNLSQIASKIFIVSSVIGGFAGMANGGEQIIMGNVLKKLDEYKANVQLGEATQNNTDSMIKQLGQELHQVVKIYEELIQTAFKAPGEVADAELRALQA